MSSRIIRLKDKSTVAAVIHELRDEFGLDDNTVTNIMGEFGDEIRMSCSLGYDPFAIANEYQSQWACRR